METDIQEVDVPLDGEVKVVVWEPDNITDTCRNCLKKFSVVTRRHHCRGCGQIFCDKCCNNWIILPPEYNYTTTQRTCNICVRKLSNLDYSRTYDIFESHIPNTLNNIIIIGGALGNRQNLIYLSEALSVRYRVISMDLPGLGARYGEMLTVDSAVNAVKEVIEKECPDKRALVTGYSMGGYVAMHFSKRYPEMCTGLVLGICANEWYGAGVAIMGSLIDTVYKVMSQKTLANITAMTFSTISRERMDRSFRRSLMHYDMWSACVEIMQEPYEGYCVECISTFPGKILFLNAEKDFRYSEEKFVAAARNGTLHVVPNAEHTMLIHQDTCNEAFKAVLDFADTVFIGDGVNEL